MRNQKTVKIMIEVEAEVDVWVQPFRAATLEDPEQPYEVAIESVLLRSKCGHVKSYITSCLDKAMVKELVMQDFFPVDDRGNEQ